MKLKFDSTLSYQDDALKSITDLLRGTPLSGNLSVPLSSETVMGSEYTELGISNPPIVEAGQVLKNLHDVQVRNAIPKSAHLIAHSDPYEFPNFSIEMETGTGKTYVYLRSIFELNKLYGLKKFVIVVPSVAIREGVTSSMRLMRNHFKGLYDNAAFDDFVYNSKDLSRVRQFARNNEIQIMVINIQAFAKDVGDDVEFSSLSDEQKKKVNVIHQERDGMLGHRPIDFIRATRPIVIIDEPQSVDNTSKSQRAISGLNPLFCLRFSATHTNPFNVVYQLDPVKAYDLRLVKQIEVVDTEVAQDFNRTFVRLDWVGYPGKAKTPQAKVTIFEDTDSGPREKQVSVKNGTDLTKFTNRPDYDGYQVTAINAEPGSEYVEFLNGEVVEVSEEHGGLTDERMKSQIRQTIEQHFIKEKKLKERGIKVLSLFFIDHVSSYRAYDENGARQNGKLAIWFEEIFAEISNLPMYRGVIPLAAVDVHEGYFSTDKKKGKVVALLDTSGSSAKDDETYELIMRDKEKLLSTETPLRFIFSHSALREGWDNPNVFQICTLREMGTDRERRQTIGRGLRLPVNQDGDRIKDDSINRLTVIANESFADFAKGLQDDIERAIDPSGAFKFGQVPQLAFTPLLNVAGTKPLTQEESTLIWQHLQDRGLITSSGEFTDSYKPESRGFSLGLPGEFLALEEAVIGRLNKYLPRDFVKNARKRQNISYNKRVELNNDFKVLWSKISQKTRYGVEFETDVLVSKAVAKIKDMQTIEAVRIEHTKRLVDITQESGVEGGAVLSSKFDKLKSTQPLPDILSFLQRETELTRGTLVRILKESGRVGEFSVNPQAFMFEVANRINRALSELIVEGIKYEPIAGKFYEMRLFEEKLSPLGEYLENLYKVQSTDDRTPFDFVPYQSDTVERPIAEALDTDERVKFFCKLPNWFKVATPLGDYNPDWAIVLEDGNKLYLVRETKSTHDRDKRRISENMKVDCGRAHFEAIGVDFRVATNVMEIFN